MTETFYTITNIEDEFKISLDCQDDTDMLLSSFRKSIANKESHSMFIKTNCLMPYHTHETSETVVLLCGSVRYIIEEDIIDLIAGDVLCINENAVHSVFGTSKSGMAHLVLMFR